MNQPLGEYVVTKLLEPYLQKGYNVTMDNMFISKSLADYMIRQNTTLLGTVRLNKRELPSNLPLIMGQKRRFETVSLACNGIVLSAYKCKPRKHVVSC